MTLVERFTSGDRQYAVLSLLPCHLQRLTDTNVAEFLRALHPDGYTEMRAFREGHDTRRYSFAAGHTEQVLEFARTYQHELNVYFGVATRITSNGGGLEHCGILNALFADLDFKKDGEQESRQRLTALPLPPSAVVNSGGGLHAYWLLAAPLDLRDGDAAYATKVLRALATALDADHKCAEPAHILRLPGTLNHKYDPPRPVTLEAFGGRIYDLTALLEVLPPLPKDESSRDDAPVSHNLSTTERIGLARDFLAARRPAIQGEGGDQYTYATACAVAIGHDLSDDETFEAMHEWNARCRPPWPDDQLREKIRNAVRYGKGTRGARLLYPTTEPGDGEFFAHLNEGHVLYDHERKQWCVFGEHHWHVDITEQIVRHGVAAIRARLRRATVIEDDTLRTRHRTWAQRGETDARIEKMLKFARSHPLLVTVTSEWDGNPLLFGVQNGAIDLETGTLHTGRSSDRVMNVSPVSFDPRADCPRWRRFLKEVFADHPEIADYMQRVFGYVLTGLTSEQVFWILWGEGANGKSTLIETFMGAVIGNDYAWVMPFPGAGWSNAMTEYQKASLVGKRLITASEVKRRAYLDEEFIKSVTGGDALNARHPYGRPFRFTPVGKIFLRVNEKPLILDQTHSMWRRVKLVPFVQTFSVNTTFGASLAAEAAGILTWAVHGCLDWQRDGLRHPDIVNAATAAYRDESDPLNEFFAERCVLETTATVTSGVLFDAYIRWCDVRKLAASDRLNQAQFRVAMRKRFDVRQGRALFYVGIGLRDVQGSSHDF